MKSFSNLTKIDINNDNLSVLEKKLKKLLESNLNITVNGNIDHYLSENIRIDGIDNLIDKLRDFTKEEILEGNRILLEQIKYQGLSVVENKINNND